MAKTLEHLARKLNVSRRTISRAISGGSYVAEDKREKILKYVEENKFFKNSQASALVSKKVHVLGLLFPKSPDADTEGSHYVLEIIKGATRAAKSKDFQVMYEAQSPYQFDACLEWVKRKIVGGILLAAPSSECEPMIRALIREGVPLAVVNARYQGVDSFACDNVLGGMMATRHLIETGKKKIAFLHGHPNWMDPEERFQGYRRALKAAGLDFKKEWVTNAYFDPVQAEKFTDELLSSRARPDAIFAANDLMAIGAMLALKKRKIKIPDEIAVIGFDDLPVCSFPLLEPTISSISQPFEEIAHAAAGHLIEKIVKHGAKAEGEGSLIFKPKLAARGSTVAGYQLPPRTGIRNTAFRDVKFY